MRYEAIQLAIFCQTIDNRFSHSEFSLFLSLCCVALKCTDKNDIHFRNYKKLYDYGSIVLRAERLILFSCHSIIWHLTVETFFISLTLSVSFSRFYHWLI